MFEATWKITVALESHHPNTVWNQRPVSGTAESASISETPLMHQHLYGHETQASKDDFRILAKLSVTYHPLMNMFLMLTGWFLYIFSYQHRNAPNSWSVRSWSLHQSPTWKTKRLIAFVQRGIPHRNTWVTAGEKQIGGVVPATQR